MALPAPAAITLGSAGAVLSAVALVAAAYELGPQSRHMGLHIVLMNIVAPVVAALAASLLRPGTATRPINFWIATVAQLLLLWFAHAPIVQSLAMSSIALQLAIHLALLLSALLFWTALVTLDDRAHWQGLLGLALTGKLVCLLAALLVFAPRTLYAVHRHGLPAGTGLDDQHLAGLIMVVACPLSYLVAATLLAVRLVIPHPKPTAPG